MFRNLKAEMILQDVSVQDIANALHIKPDTARLKVNGKIGISLDDCYKVAALFKENNKVEYLFEKKDKKKENKN